MVNPIYWVGQKVAAGKARYDIANQRFQAWQQMKKQQYQQSRDHHRTSPGVTPTRAGFYAGVGGLAAGGAGYVAGRTAKARDKAENVNRHVRQGGSSDKGAFVVACILMALMKVGLATSGPGLSRSEWTAMNIVFTIIVLFVFFRHEWREVLPHIAVILVLEVGLLWLSLSWLPWVQQIPILRWILFNPGFMWAWYYYAIFNYVKIEGNFLIALLNPLKGFQFLKAWTALFWIIVLIGLIANVTTGYDLFGRDQTFVITAEQQLVLYEMFEQGWTFAKDTVWVGIKALPNTISKFFNRQIALATGDYYTGRVDENENQPLGVYIEDMKAAAREFDPQEKPAIYATLTGRTLEDGISIQLRCFAGDDEKRERGDYHDGKTIPSESFTIFDLEQQPIDCLFDEPTRTGMDSGSHRVTFAAEFNFETLAYMKTYFMDNDKLIALRRQGIDPLDEFEIKDKKPTAIFTNGPVMIGMGIDEPPIGIGPTRPIQPRLGITIENNVGWQGRIKEVQELVIQVPNEITIEPGDCSSYTLKEYTQTDCEASCTKYVHKRCTELCAISSHAGNVTSASLTAYQTACKQECDEDLTACNDNCGREFAGYHAYQFDTSDPYVKAALSEIDPYKTFTCRLTVDPSKYQDLLDGSPVATKYMRAKTKYIYELEEKANLKIRRDDSLSNQPGVDDETLRKAGDADLVRGIYLNYYLNKPYIKDAADTHNVDACLLIALIGAESRGIPSAVSPTGCAGIMQFCKGSAKDYGLCDNAACTGRDDRFDPEKAIPAGAKHLRDNMNAYSSHPQAQEEFGLAAYNAGEATINTAVTNAQASEPGTPATFDKLKNGHLQEAVKQHLGHMSYFDTPAEQRKKADEIITHNNRVMSLKQTCEDVLNVQNGKILDTPTPTGNNDPAQYYEQTITQPLLPGQTIQFSESGLPLVQIELDDDIGADEVKFAVFREGVDILSPRPFGLDFINALMNVDRDADNIGAGTSLAPGEWFYFSEYPFVQFKFVSIVKETDASGVDEDEIAQLVMQVRYVKNVVVDVGQLPADSSNVPVNDAINDLISVIFTGKKLEFYTYKDIDKGRAVGNYEKICSLPWGPTDNNLDCGDYGGPEGLRAYQYGSLKNEWTKVIVDYQPTPGVTS